MKEKVVGEKEISDEKKRESLKPHNRRSNTTKSRKKGGERESAFKPSSYRSQSSTVSVPM